MADRNFDDLAERFQRRVYGGLKGRIRLAVLQRDLQELIESSKPPLSVLDVGTGLGQLAIEFAAHGHRVTCCDVSPSMLSLARQTAQEKGVDDRICWQNCAYQDLAKNTQDGEQYDLILCHALLEWVDEPAELLAFCARSLKPGAYLSLAFYNPAAKEYRNLIRGNFDWLDAQQDYQSDRGSLTPNNPSTPEWAHDELAAHGMRVVGESGIRVFSDYVVEKRGGHVNADLVVAKELEYSTRKPFLTVARYLHYMVSL